MGIISYFTPKILFSGSSQFNQDIKVVQVMGVRKLLVNGIVQSFSPNSRPASRKVWGNMAKIIAKRPKINNLLLLGMGAGTVLYLLRNKYKLDCRFTGVEIDPEIITLAKKYFRLDDITENQIVTADAHRFVTKAAQSLVPPIFDCVVIDTYFGPDFPASLSSQDFYTAVISLLSRDGLLVVNRIINKDDTTTVPQIQKELKKHVETLKTKKVRCPVISDNYIFYGLKMQA